MESIPWKTRMRTMIKTIISKLFNKYMTGLYALLLSSPALAAAGSLSTGGLVAILVAFAVVAGILVVANSDDDDDGVTDVSAGM